MSTHHTTTPTFNYLQVDGPLTPPSSDKVLPSHHTGDDFSLDSLSSLGEALVAAPPYTPAKFFPELNCVDEEDLLREGDGVDGEKGAWFPGMSIELRKERRDWLMEGRGRKGLRIVIVTENFLPKVDGVTRTLARLLEHLEREGHECMVLGPQTGMTHYASHPLVGTLGIPLVVYSGLKLNFLRPRFLCRIHDFQPDVVHFVDPIWLGGQTTMAMERGWAGTSWDKRRGHQAVEEIQGAVVASYHTNLGTYATLFGMRWLEPIIWKWQRYLYSRYNLTLCPSPSTASLLKEKRFADSSCRLWPRGVELNQFHPSKRSAILRRSWGVYDELESKIEQPERDGLLTPPCTPLMGAADAESLGRVVVLYVGRVSWEKNLMLLLRALMVLQNTLPKGFPTIKAVFVGDGPARQELENICREHGIDATFMGQVVGEKLAECYASADVFCFPSFTETFGQVVLEALASGLPVIGLDADGTRDLVTHGKTGLLLPLPSLSRKTVRAVITVNDWPRVCKDASSEAFASTAASYAKLIADSVIDEKKRMRMGRTACTEGIKGYTWWDAMESCVDGYRESMRISKGHQQERLARDSALPNAALVQAFDRMVSRLTSKTFLISIIFVLIFMHYLRIPTERNMTVAATT